MNIQSVVESLQKSKLPELAPGDTVRVKVKIVEGEKSRTQAFQGVIIRIKRGGAGASFTVRRVAYGIGIERTFQFNSPSVEGVDVIRHGKVRRAKLYYLRGLSTKASRIKERRVAVPVEGEAPTEEEAAPEVPPAEATAQPQAGTPIATTVQSSEQPKAEAPAEPTKTVAEAPPATESKAEPPASEKEPQ